jgi:hypothetical protein
MSSPTHPSPKDDGKSASVMDVPVLVAIGELLAAAAQMLDGDAIRRLGGPGLYRRLASVLTAFVTFAMVMLVRQRASIARRSFVHTICEARRHLSHPPAGWAAP